METNNCNTDLQVVSQEYPYEEESLQTKTKKTLETSFTKRHLETQELDYQFTCRLPPLCYLPYQFFFRLTGNNCTHNDCRTWLSFTGRKRKERNAS